MLYQINDFFSPEECDEIFQKRKLFSETEDDRLKDFVVKSDNRFWEKEFKTILERSQEHLHKFFEPYLSLFPVELLGISHLGFLSEVHGDFTEMHYDWDIIKVEGQVISKPLVMIVYLNNVELGGDLYFPLLDGTVETSKGKAAIFPCHFTFPHVSTPVIKGEKHIMRVTFSLSEEIFESKGLEL